jgi:hypothetical protein
MAGFKNLGTLLVACLMPYWSTDEYATHDEIYGAGGYRSVADLAARNSITVERRRPGMLVDVRSEGENGVVYRLQADLQTWTVFATGGGDVIVSPEFSVFEDGEAIGSFTALNIGPGLTVVADPDDASRALIDLGAITVAAENVTFDFGEIPIDVDNVAEALIGLYGYASDGFETIAGQLTDVEGEINALDTRVTTLEEAEDDIAAPVVVNANANADVTWHGRVVEVTAAAIITLPHALPSGWYCFVIRRGAGAVSFASPDAIESDGAHVAIAARYKGVSPYRTSANAFGLVGALA